MTKTKPKATGGKAKTPSTKGTAAKKALEPGVIDARLEKASAHAKKKEYKQALGVLDEARDLALAAGDDKGLVKVCVTLAKAHHDFGNGPGFSAALVTLLDRKIPFLETRFRSVHDWIFWYWDRFGYADPMPVRVFSLWAEIQQSKRKNGPSVEGMALVAWQHACTGNLPAMRKLMATVRAPEFLKTEDFPVDEILFDSAFLAGIWADDAALAREGRDFYLDYLTRAGIQPEDNHQFLRGAVRAALLFDWKDDWARYRGPYLEGLGTMNIGYEKNRMEGIRSKALQALSKGDARDALEHFRQLTAYADEKKLGPEWVAEGSVECARMCAMLGNRVDATNELKAALMCMEKYGVTVFQQAIEKLYVKLNLLS